MSHGCTAIGEDAAHERTGEVDSLVIERGRGLGVFTLRFDLFEDTMCSADMWRRGRRSNTYEVDNPDSMESRKIVRCEHDQLGSDLMQRDFILVYRLTRLNSC
jgi:hypothetical protein